MSRERKSDETLVMRVTEALMAVSYYTLKPKGLKASSGASLGTVLRGGPLRLTANPTRPMKVVKSAYSEPKMVRKKRILTEYNAINSVFIRLRVGSPYL